MEDLSDILIVTREGGPVTADLALARRHVEMIAGSPDATVNVRLIHARDRDREAHRLNGSLAGLWPEIEAAQSDGFDVFVVVNEGGDRDEDISRVRAVFVDADDVPMPGAWHAKPDFIVRRDATHWHAYWRVEGLAVEDFRDAQKRLAARYGTDTAVCNPSRVMRLAGSVHQKAAPRRITLEGSAGALTVHPAADVLSALPPAPKRRQTASAAAGEPISVEELTAALAYLDPDVGRETWIKYVAAIRAAPIPFDENEGIRAALAQRWSRGDLDRQGRYRDAPPSRYTTGDDVERAFDTLPPKDDGVTVGTIIHDARAAGWSPHGSAAASFGPAVAALHAAVPDDAFKQDRRAGLVASFRAREPDEDADLPDLEYWDAEKTLPKQPGGCVGIAFGPSGVGKTTVILGDLLGYAVAGGAKVLYCAGEGAFGLGKQRVPAECEARGVTPGDLRGKWRLVWRSPSLLDPEHVEALIEAHSDFRPDIVVIDTLATAIGGENEDSSATASAVDKAGRRIAQAWNATVIVVHHAGKDETRGARGSSGWEGNADFAHVIGSNKEAGTAKLHIKKMRDGPDGFSVFYRVSRSPRGVPLARRIPENEYRTALGTDTTSPQRDVYHALKRLSRGPAGPITTRVLAEELVPLVKGQDLEEREKHLHNEVKRLQGLTRPNRYSKAPGPLAVYVARDHRNQPLNPIEWVFPFGDDDGESDSE
ncbi:MAG TPA: AAA family ATPase [Caulobacteraceae bacterium]|jgi:hypothetical protein|nr:AAA family ATPase [Caulobacteraceae bacterium]